MVGARRSIRRRRPLIEHPAFRPLAGAQRPGEPRALAPAIEHRQLERRQLLARVDLAGRDQRVSCRRRHGRPIVGACPISQALLRLMGMRLRLYPHPDGARVAYRELGAGPPLALLHSALLSHMEWEPAVEQLADRFRVVLPDPPLHGDSEDRPRHPYTLDWFADVMSGFAADVLGPRPLIGGHDAGAEILLHAVSRGSLRPKRLRP